MDGMVVAHCDWGKDPKKRWMAVASRPGGGDFTAAATVMVGSTSTLLDRPRGIAGQRPVLIGFDFPVGIPRAYADAAGIEFFPDFLRVVAGSAASTFFDPAVEIGDISIDRPFYPRRPKGSKRQHLVDALGLNRWDELFRVCERGTEERSPAITALLVGRCAAGRAGRDAGWQEVVAPALAREDVRLWPSTATSTPWPPRQSHPVRAAWERSCDFGRWDGQLHVACRDPPGGRRTGHTVAGSSVGALMQCR